MFRLQICFGVTTIILVIQQQLLAENLCSQGHACELLRPNLRMYLPSRFREFYRQTEADHLKLADEEIIKYKLWRNGVIPYYIDKFSFDPTSVYDLRVALNTFSAVTGMHFWELSKAPDANDTIDDKRYVFFINRQSLLECEDFTSRNLTTKGVQRVVIGYDCLTSPEKLAPILLGIVGVPPQHNAPNRGQYIKIIEQNILPDKKELFKQMTDDEWGVFKGAYKEYDLESAGHFDLMKHSANGKATIELVDQTRLDSRGTPCCHWPVAPRCCGKALFPRFDSLNQIGTLCSKLTRGLKFSPTLGCADINGDPNMCLATFSSVTAIKTLKNIVQNQGLSKGDLKKIAILYGDKNNKNNKQRTKTCNKILKNDQNGPVKLKLVINNDVKQLKKEVQDLEDFFSDK